MPGHIICADDIPGAARINRRLLLAAAGVALVIAAPAEAVNRPDPGNVIEGKQVHFKHKMPGNVIERRRDAT